MAFLAILLTSWFHPFHVSVTNVYHKADKNVVQMEIRIFLDDLEKALRGYSGDEKLNVTEGNPKYISRVLNAYLQEKISLVVDGKTLQMSFVGNEPELSTNVMWCYYEIQEVNSLSEFKVRNTVLFEEFDDQENIIHYRKPDATDSERTYDGKIWAEF